MKNIFKALPAVFVIFLMIGSACGAVVNYNETYETVENNITIDNPPVIDEETQELVNVKNKTYDEVTVTNETIENITYKETTQKQVGEKTVYTHGGKNYKGAEIDKVVLADGTVIKYADNKNLASCNPKPVSKYVPATLYLKNGTVLDIVIHNEGNSAYQNYGYRTVVPVYEDVVTEYNNITNKITTYINHVVEVIYEIIDKPVPVPDPVDPVNNTTDPILDPVVNNTTDPVVDVPSENNSVDEPVDTLKNHETGNCVNGIVAAIIIIAGCIYLLRHKED